MKRLSRLLKIALFSFGLVLGIGGALSIARVSAASPVETKAIAYAYRSFTFGKDHTQEAVGSYDWSWFSETNGYRVTLDKFSNNANTWNYVKCGRYSRASVATIIPNDAIDQPINRVVVTVDAIDYPQYVNSQKLYVASDNKFTQNVQTVPLALKVGENIFYISSPASNMYYKIAYDLQGSKKSSETGFIQISKVEYWKGSTPAVQGVTINKTSASMYVNDKLTLTVTPSPSNAGNKTIYWRCSPTGIVELPSSNSTSINVTALKAGKTTVTAETADGYFEAYCEITVSKIDVTGVTLDKENMLLYAGESGQLTATVLPSNASEKTCTWSTSNSKVATVDSNGKVTGVGGGTATITVSSKDSSLIRASCAVRVIGNCVTLPYAEPAVDLFTYESVGITKTTTTSWTGKTFGSGAKFSGRTSGANEKLTFTGSGDVIVSTTSSGTACKIKVVWAEGVEKDTGFNVYISPNAYSSTSSLINSATQGILFGRIIKGTNDELTITSSAKYVGLRPYYTNRTFGVESISIEWKEQADVADAAAINDFVANYMHLEYNENSVSYDPSAMKCINENWYFDAKDVFENGSLTAGQKEVFLTTDAVYGTVGGMEWTYAKVLERLSTWAEKNNDHFNTSTGVFYSSHGLLAGSAKEQTPYFLIVIGLAAAASLFGLLFFVRSKNKHHC